MSSAIASPCGSAGPPARAATTATSVAGRDLAVRLDDRLAADADRALPDQRLHAAARKARTEAAASHWSRRWPAASAGTINPPCASLSGALIASPEVPMRRPGLRRRTRKSRSTRRSRRVRRKLVRFVAINLGLLFARPYGGGRAIVYKSRRRHGRPRCPYRHPVPRCRAGRRDRAAGRGQDGRPGLFATGNSRSTPSLPTAAASSSSTTSPAKHRRPLHGDGASERAGSIAPAPRSRRSRWSSPTMTRRSPGTRESSASR